MLDNAESVNKYVFAKATIVLEGIAPIDFNELICLINQAKIPLLSSDEPRTRFHLEWVTDRGPIELAKEAVLVISKKEIINA